MVKFIKNFFFESPCVMRFITATKNSYSQTPRMVLNLLPMTSEDRTMLLQSGETFVVLSKHVINVAYVIFQL